MSNDHYWYKKRRYKHFDKPLSSSEAIQLTSSPSKVTHHGFYPFLGCTIYTPKYRHLEHSIKHKPRNIAYAAHSDAHIFAYYSHLLSPKYEEQLDHRGISDSVIAYRRIPGKKCNIHFAKEAFEQIVAMGDCIAMVFDVDNFFGTINHQLLKQRWCQLLESNQLPTDHYAIYKHITKYASVDRNSVFQMFRIGQRRSKQYWKPICSSQDFRNKVRSADIIKPNRNETGIPQGSPISAMLSNLYMLEFDTNVSNTCKSIGAVYRRYSDDILLICKKEKRAFLLDVLNTELHKVHLSLNEKSKESEFLIGNNGALCTTNPIQYLGFIFDGKRILIRSQTISKYLGKMRRAVHFASLAAKISCQRGGDPRRYSRKIMRSFSGLGRARNYSGYIKRANLIIGNNTVKNQHRKCWRTVNKLLQRPVCTEPCIQCKKENLQAFKNRLGHGEYVTRDTFCPCFEATQRKQLS